MNGRHLEFRIWDKLLRKMMPDYNFVSFDNNEYEFMQATDFVDVNGKRIFEGDILGSDVDGQYRCVVECKQGCLGGQFATFRTFLKDFYIERNTNKIADYQVIGNVFETPELLPYDPKEKE